MFNTSFDTINKCLEAIRGNLPESVTELHAAFDSMIKEGLIMNISLLLSRLSSTDLQNPLLVRTLNMIILYSTIFCGSWKIFQAVLLERRGNF